GLRARDAMASLRPAHDHGAVARAGDGAAHEQEVVVVAHGDDLDVERRHALGAVATGHALALEHAAREGAVADRAAVPELLVRAVRGGKSAEAVALDHARGAAPLGDARDLHALARREDVADGDRHADRRDVAVAEAELAQDAERARRRLLEL